MKKTRTNIFIYIAAVLSLLLSGCSEEDTYQEGTDDAARTALSLQVNATAYHSSVGTRASDTGTATTFTDGDRLGIIVTHPDNSVEHFVYTYSGYYASWSTPNPAYYDSRDSYAAYYPYKEALRGKSLADVKSAFTPLANQSDYATGYVLSDLMTCEKATIGANKSLQITLTHAFPMLRFPVNVPVKSKCEDNNTYQYSVSVKDIVIHIGDTPYRAWVGNDGYARLIVDGSNSGSDITVKSFYTLQGKRTETSATVSSFASGLYYTLTPSESVLDDYKFSDVRVGDFYCRNSSGSGFVLPKEASLPDGLKNNCLGIVYWLGDIKGDNYTLLDSKFSDSGTHGLVVSLWNLADPDNGNANMLWTYGSYEYVNTWLGSATWSDGNTKPESFSSIQVTDKKQGYANTIALQEYNKYIKSHTAGSGESADDYGQSGKKRVKPIIALESFRTAHAAPSNSSDWYWPSIYELKYVCWGQDNGEGTSGKDMLNSQIEKVGGDVFRSDNYWSSTEDSSYSYWAWYVYFDNGGVYYVGSKNYDTYCVRPLLAF